MALIGQVTSSTSLSPDLMLNTIHSCLAGQFRNRRVLVLIPDHTRSLPLPFLFRVLIEVLHNAKQLDFMVALGTHPMLSNDEINKLVGITTDERMSEFKRIGLLNHAWNDPNALTTLGEMKQDEIREIAGKSWHPSLPNQVDISINKAAIEYDHILILGPTFPHEVVGHSGGAKYLFPGISGAEMINATHWLGALAGVVATIGIKETPVRAMINAAAAKLTTPVTLIALTVEDHDLSGIFIGDLLTAWNAAADLSAQRHVKWCEKPFQRVLSCPSPMYNELWTAAKAMYKIEPAVKVGGEVVIYAPHLNQVSQVHGRYIYEVGYHVTSSFPFQLGSIQTYPSWCLGTLHSSTRIGCNENGIEKANVKVSLASKISAVDREKLNLGYLTPAQSISMNGTAVSQKEFYTFPRPAKYCIGSRADQY